MGGSPCLVVIGDVSFSRGRGFKSQRWILDGHFLTLIFCKYCIVCLFEKIKINEKRGRGWPIFKIVLA